MKKYSIVVLIFLFLLVGCTSKFIENDAKIKSSNNSLKESTNMIKIVIDNNEYMVNLEDNETTKKLLEYLPLQVNMSDLNDNEKYVYLDFKLPTNEYSPKHINKGDVMLFGNNCLVIFYKSFDTTYSYTKIGNIYNLPDLDNGNILVNLNNK